MGYVLKHDEFKDLRSDGSNYMAKFSDPRTYELIFDMYKDVIEATKGVDYLHVSTDEVYYAGIDPEDQKVRPYNPENRSLWLVEFVNKARDFAAKFNRRIFVWVEMPVLPQHVEKLPADIIDGIVGNPDYVATEKKMGMRTPSPCCCCTHWPHSARPRSSNPQSPIGYSRHRVVRNSLQKYQSVCENLSRRDLQKLPSRRGQDLIAFEPFARDVLTVECYGKRQNALIAAINHPVSRDFKRRINRPF